MVRTARPLGIPHNHSAYHQRVTVYAGDTYQGAFFTIDWENGLLEIYGREGIAIPLGEISSITVYNHGQAPCSFVFNHKDERLLDDETILAAYARQAWTNNGTTHLHQGATKRKLSKADKLLASLGLT